ncbi:hypothetical protein NQZ68_000102, partial [Dissostichus eleginoides]
YRSVPLKNSYNEDLELASLLVHMDIISGRDENGEVLSPFIAVGAASVTASSPSGRERSGESVSSTSSNVSPVPQSPAQAQAYREGSFESRYQSPLEDFRVSQEALLDHMDPQNRQT